LQWKMLVYFTAIWYILWPFGVFYGYLVNFGICNKKNLATLVSAPSTQINGKQMHVSSS
jgi:hypothetical protein